ncbi:DUF5626 family protein [Planococcus dechangensis]|uniref:DUF5626 family protein n=1 Tax=Planococcus dechangensis TaxID=1176255 RepID=A0ABV9ME85_9BACL
MNFNLKRFITLMITLILVSITISPSAFANGNGFGNGKGLENGKGIHHNPFSEEVEFDLTKAEKQEFVFIGENGEEVTYGAEPVIYELDDSVINSGGDIGILSNLTRTNTIKLGTSTWKIYIYSGSINMEYFINVSRTSSSTKITRAYDLWTMFVGYTENNRKFTFTSTRAEYTSTANLFNSFASISIRLTASVSGSTLTTSAKY